MVHQTNPQIMSISGWMSFIFLANCWVGTAGQNQNINDLLEFSQQFGKPAAEWDSGPQFFYLNLRVSQNSYKNARLPFAPYSLPGFPAETGSANTGVATRLTEPG